MQNASYKKKNTTKQQKPTMTLHALAVKTTQHRADNTIYFHLAFLDIL